MNVRGERLNVTGKLLVKDVAISSWNVCMRQIAVPAASRIPSKFSLAIQNHRVFF